MRNHTVRLSENQIRVIMYALQAQQALTEFDVRQLVPDIETDHDPESYVPETLDQLFATLVYVPDDQYQSDMLNSFVL